MKNLFSRFKFQFLNTRKRRRVFVDVFKSVNGFLIAKAAQEKEEFRKPQYVYGEVRFPSFIQLISSLNPKSDEVFYDLGSGIGKSVIIAAISFNLKKVCGIEIVPELYEASLNCLNRLKKHPYSQNLIGQTEIKFIQADILTTDFFDADIVFINATAFLGEFWEQVEKRLAYLTPGTRIITATKQILGPGFKLLRYEQVYMTWGFATVFIYEKL